MHCIALRCVEDTCLTSLALIGRGGWVCIWDKMDWSGLLWIYIVHCGCCSILLSTDDETNSFGGAESVPYSLLGILLDTCIV
jgi:hypothetical protein